MSHGDLIGTAEAAEILGVDRSTISRWIQAGRLAPKIQLAGRTGAMLFDRSEVEALTKADAA